MALFTSSLHQVSFLIGCLLWLLLLLKVPPSNFCVILLFRVLLDWEKVWKIECIYLGTLPSPPKQDWVSDSKEESKRDIGQAIRAVCHNFWIPTCVLSLSCTPSFIFKPADFNYFRDFLRERRSHFKWHLLGEPQVTYPPRPSSHTTTFRNPVHLSSPPPTPTVCLALLAFPTSTKL